MALATPLALGFGGTMVRVGDKLILLSQSGRLTLARADATGFVVISSVNDVVDGSEVWATPVIYKGRLYTKGASELVCIELRAKN